MEHASGEKNLQNHKFADSHTIPAFNVITNINLKLLILYTTLTT